jgi:F-type H+-transporting ATPase subunit gamma
MNFVSTGLQKPEALKLLPLPKADELLERVASDIAEKEAKIAAGTMAARRDAPAAAIARVELQAENLFEFVPDAATLLDEVLPLSVKAGVFQAFLDATTSEHVARMVAMKAATDNADKMAKGLTLQYNRARQSQITTELSEIMGGVEAMK